MRSPTGATLHWTTLTVPLRPRGEKAAKAIGQEISRLSLTPDLILWSPPGVPAIRWRSPRPNSKPGLPPGSLRIFMTSAMAAARWKSSARKAERHSASCWWGTTRPLRKGAKRLVGSGPADLRKGVAAEIPTGALACDRLQHIPLGRYRRGQGSAEALHPPTRSCRCRRRMNRFLVFWARFAPK